MEEQNVLIEQLEKDFIELADNYDNFINSVRYKDKFPYELNPIYLTDQVLQMYCLAYLTDVETVDYYVKDNLQIWKEILGFLSFDKAFMLKHYSITKTFTAAIIRIMNEMPTYAMMITFSTYITNLNNVADEVRHSVHMDHILSSLIENPTAPAILLYKIEEFYTNRYPVHFNAQNVRAIVRKHPNYQNNASMILESIQKTDTND